jgi:hypothetical protein
MDTCTDEQTDGPVGRPTREQIEKLTDGQPKKFMNRQIEKRIYRWTNG